MKIIDIHDSIVFRDESLTKRILFADRNILTFLLNLKPGQTIPDHKHETSTLVLTVLQGKAQIKVNHELAEVKQGDFLSVKGNEDFGIPKVTENLTLHVTLGPNPTNEIFSKEI